MPVSTPTPATSDDLLDRIRDQVQTAAAAASEKLAINIAILEVGSLVGITDFFLIFSTANDRQLGSAIDEVEGKVREQHDRKPLSREGSKEAGWVVLDFGDYVIHGFTNAQHDLYDLERLWGDAPRVPFIDRALPVEDPAQGPA